MRIYRSLHQCGDGVIAEARLKACLWRVHTFGLSLTRLDIRQESTRHMDVLDELCSYLGLGSYRTWSEETKVQWLTNELHSKRPLLPRVFVDEVCAVALRQLASGVCASGVCCAWHSLSASVYGAMILHWGRPQARC